MLDQTNLINFAELLLKNNVIWRPLMDKALKRLEEIGAKTPRAFAKIVVHEFNIPHDKVYSKLAEMYAFRTVELKIKELSENEKEDSKKIIDQFSMDFRKKLFYNKIFPFKIMDGSSETLLVLSADPTNKLAKEITLTTDFKKIEIAYCNLKSINELIQIISPEKNEFLELLEESGDEIVDVATNETKVDQTELDNKITKSVLVPF